MTGWTLAQTPDLRGRTAVVTGASSGVGYETALRLAGQGAEVVLACRDLDKARRAAERIRGQVPAARLEIVHLDLTSLTSVRQAAAALRDGRRRIDVLVNNAGVMRTPDLRTSDGFELQFGTNHLGHFAFTGLLLDPLLTAPGSRIVTVSSPAHRQAKIDGDEILPPPSGYRPGPAYARSKLANLLFAFELQRRLVEVGAQTISLAAHPGGSRTELNRSMPAWMLARGPSWGIWRPITHSAERGALSLLRAALDPDARGGDYYCPQGFMEFKGLPGRGESSARSHDEQLQRRLWAESERLTGVRYDFARAVASPHT